MHRAFWLAAAVLAVATLTQSASAQPTPEQQSAIRSNCRSDFMSKCSGVTPGGKDAVSLMSRIFEIDALDAADATRAELAGRRQVKTMVRFLRERVPGFENAILASIAIPVLFKPVWHRGRYLVDGGLSNPLPVSVALRLSAAPSVAVNVSPVEIQRGRVAEQVKRALERSRNWVET